MKRYRLTPAAKADLKAIWAYTEDHWGARQADRYLNELAHAMETLAGSPELGPARDDIRSGYRSFPVGRHVAFYRISKNTIDIVRVLHQSMDTSRHL